MIPENLQSILTYNENDIIIRETNDRMMSTMTKEFVHVLSNLFPLWNRDEWEAVEFYKKEKDAYCICSNPITNVCLIEHMPTNTIIQVGCECVKKISNKTYKEMLRLKKKYEKEQLDNQCIDCKKDISSQRIKYPTIKQCWDCRDAHLTNECKRCRRKIQSDYKLCYGCNKNK